MYNFSKDSKINMKLKQPYQALIESELLDIASIKAFETNFSKKYKENLENY